MTYFVEKLTFKNWFCSVLPRLLYSRVSRGRNPDHCYFFDSSRLATLAARATAWMSAVPIEKLRFRLVDVRDKEGLFLRLRIACQDLAEVQADATDHVTFRSVVGEAPKNSRLSTYLAKALANMSIAESGTLLRALLLVQISLWKVRDGGNKKEIVLFLELRPWVEAIERYALRHGVSIIRVSPTLKFSLRALARRLLGPKGIKMLRALRDGSLYQRFFIFSKRQTVSGVGHSSTNHARARVERLSRGRRSSTPLVGVEPSGHFNVSRPELHSDLFFWQQSSLPGNDVVVISGLPQDPLDEAKWRELTRHGIRAVALRPEATTISAVPAFTHRPSGRQASPERPRLFPVRGGLEEAWLRKHLCNYWAARGYWADLFAAENIKVYVSWYKFDSTHCAIADAIQSLGGISVIYQRSCELDPCAGIAADTDIMFGFSSMGAEIERQSGSIIRYHVATGYLGDHRFPLWRKNGGSVRDEIKRHGAKHILAYFDENSLDEARWYDGHEFTRGNYAFLFEKLLSEPWLGLVLKPKTPRTLRRRLGPVAELLDRAQATGRCYMYEGGALQGSYPPAAGAMEADIAIHGHLCAGTAGMEAALAGVPTLLVDREGWHVSPLYRLGIGRVVFTDWQELWEACVQHWASSGGVPGFGDWSPMLDELDPFRDGRAAERLGTYIQWLIEGFKAGLGRDTVMADAAERYCDLWGMDKVAGVTSRSLTGSNGGDELASGLLACTSRHTTKGETTSQLQQRS